jgi:dihydrofolate reductase
MGKIVISTNVSLDGVVEDPDGQDGTRNGGWFARYGGADLEPWGGFMLEETRRIDALLIGRRTDEWFAPRWSERPGEWADALNALPKYVVSSTIDEPQWTNAKVLGGDVVEQVQKLKETIDGDIVVYASYQLGRTLFAHDLVDEVRLFVFPVVLGEGERLFGSGLSGTAVDPAALRLTESRTIGESLVHLRYDVVRGG